MFNSLWLTGLKSPIKQPTNQLFSTHRSGELRTQKLISPLLRRTQSPKVLPLKHTVGQNKATHALPAAKDIFLELIFIFWCIHLYFLQNLLRVFPVLAVANTSSYVGPNDKTGHPAHRYDAGSGVSSPQDINRLENKCYFISGFAFRNCGYIFDSPRQIGVFYEVFSVLSCTGSLWNIFTELLFKHRKEKTCGLMTCRLNNWEID